MFLRTFFLSFYLCSFGFAMIPSDETIFGPFSKKREVRYFEELDITEDEVDTSWQTSVSPRYIEISDEEDDENTRSSDSESQSSEDTFQIVDLKDSIKVKELSKIQKCYYEMAKDEKLSGSQRMGAIAHLEAESLREYFLMTLVEDESVEMNIRKDAARVLKKGSKNAWEEGKFWLEQWKLEETKPLRQKLLEEATPKGLENLETDREKHSLLRSCFAAFKKIPLGTSERTQAAERIMKAAPAGSPYKNGNNFILH